MTIDATVKTETVCPNTDCGIFYSPTTQAALKTLEYSKITDGKSHENKTYVEITRRIKKHDRPDIEQKMSAFSDENLLDFLSLVNEGNISEITKIRDYPFLALLAVKKGELSQEDFATIVMPHASMDDEIECVNLFSNDQPNDDARKLLERTLQMGEGFVLSAKEVDRFFHKMHKLPKIQQHFWVESVIDEKKSIRTGIADTYGKLNIFSKINRTVVMVPSAGMMQTLLDIKFSKNAVKMNFVLGLSTPTDIEANGRTSTRDAALQFPLIPLPAEADGYLATGTDFTYHDFFHAIFASFLPHELRCAVVDIAKEIKILAQKMPQEKQQLMNLYERVVDMETTGQYQKIKNRELEIQPIDEFIYFIFGSIFKSNISILSTIYIAAIVTRIAAKTILSEPKFYTKEPLQVLNFLGQIPIIIIMSFFNFLFK